MTRMAIRSLRPFALVLGLSLLTACTTMEEVYDSAADGVNDIFGDTPTYQEPPTKVAVQSPTAAPVQDVKAAEVNPSVSPVQLGAMHDGTAAQDSAAADASAPPVTPTTSTNAHANLALLTIRFNQPHVYYEDALKQAVTAAQQTKSDVLYEVLSTIPDLSSLPGDQQIKLAERAKNNLRSVVLKIQEQGVSADRVRIAEQTLKVRSQEIHVYVR